MANWNTDSGLLALTSVSARGLAGDAHLSSEGEWLMALIVTNTDAAAAAAVELYDGTDSNGAYLFTIAAAAGHTASWGPAIPGWPLRSGLFAHVIAGTVSVSALTGGPP